MVSVMKRRDVEVSLEQEFSCRIKWEAVSYDVQGYKILQKYR